MAPVEVPALRPLAARVVDRYAGCSRYARGFVQGKLLTDPATGAILRLAAAKGGFGRVADLGCGRGQVGLALLLAGLAESVAGLDLDAGKIADAKRAAAGLPAGYEAADLALAPVPPCDTVLIFDVLLQMPVRAQLDLVARMAEAAQRRVVIRAFDPDCGWRARLGSAMEEAGRRLRRDGSAFEPLPLARLEAPLRERGFQTRVTPCWGWTPLPNVMLVAERPR
ncbi:methyltransferase domain-containing protein [Roseococcus sp. YIM B11640]|uniref:methyltransferase domain-containing protein n=1 Tax=Roseococcus sp. YIM B11640 TaxID=3133973 RepID=UPI003C7AC372